MKKLLWSIVLITIVLGVFLFLFRVEPTVAQFFDPPLTAIQTDSPPTIDGIADDTGWEQAEAIVSEVKDGSIGKVDVTLRSVYDAENIYFLIKWPDATESIDNTEAGDRLAIIWQVSEISGFEITGCNQACHSGFPLGMWLEEEGQGADFWIWEAANTNPLGHMDDRYLGYSLGEDWRFADAGDLESGSRADITAQAIWADGIWTLEISRALNTGEHAIGDDGTPVDVSFEVGQPYYFGLAVMDDANVEHSVADFALGFIMEGDAGATGEETSETINQPTQPTDREVHYDEVVVNRVDTPPELDGISNDTVWAENDVSVINVNGGAIRRVDVTIQAVYDDQNLYMVLQWADDTESVDRRLWTYTRDGWEHESKEDRFSILWQITDIDGFETIGCNIACHSDDPPIGMWFNNPGEYGDLWNWKASRTNPMGFIDDAWMGPYSGHPDGGRYVDPGISSYARNEVPSGDAPAFVWRDINARTNPPAIDATENFLLDVDVVPITELMAFSVGDTVPGYILRQPSGSRADIQARGIWLDGTWTVELVRPLDTGENAILADGTTPVDITFAPGETYYFSLVVMDNTDQDHSTEEIGIAFRIME